jgi:hypothetical protein
MTANANACTSRRCLCCSATFDALTRGGRTAYAGP